MNDTVLKIEHLTVEYRLAGRSLPAVRDLSLELCRNECLAIVGESGSGKSTLARACLGLLEQNGRVAQGSILIGGADVAAFHGERAWQRANIRGRHISMVLQNPATALNPLIPIGAQIGESFRINHRGMRRQEIKKAVLSLLRDSGFEDPELIYRYYPCQMSGGMQQRAAIAMAVACGPEILILDECTSSLDVTTQAEILNTLQAFRKKYPIALILITHDMGVVAKLADRIAVMYAGQIVEIGTCDEVFFDPRHPYTWTLFAAIPQLCAGNYAYRRTSREDPRFLPGDPFARSNPYTVLEIDKTLPPPLFQVSRTHFARTWLLDPRAPEIPPPACIRDISGLRAAWGE